MSKFRIYLNEKHRNNSESCPSKKSWKVKFKYEFECFSCPICDFVGRGCFGDMATHFWYTCVLINFLPFTEKRFLMHHNLKITRIKFKYEKHRFIDHDKAEVLYKEIQKLAMVHLHAALGSLALILFLLL